MSAIIRLDHISQYNEIIGVETLHPLITYADCRTLNPIRHSRKLVGFFGIFIKDTLCGELIYGRNTYDYKEGSAMFIAPGQILGLADDGQYHQPSGYLLVFHPDLLRGTSLANCMKDYSFFYYESNEALHLSGQERKILLECFDKIQTELLHPIDKHTKSLIIDNVKLFLDYSQRFYDRQFITRENINHDVLTRFEKELDSYFNSDLPEKNGLPSVQYFAEKFNLSANYFSDLIKKETGTNALKYIHLKILDAAKTKVLHSGKSFSEIAYELGFSYPQHFSRFFKKEVGCSPNEYRRRN